MTRSNKAIMGAIITAIGVMFVSAVANARLPEEHSRERVCGEIIASDSWNQSVVVKTDDGYIECASGLSAGTDVVLTIEDGEVIKVTAIA